MKHIHTFEQFVNEAYKQVPYNKKVNKAKKAKK